MNRLDRTMGILLLLRGGRIISAKDLASRFEVSMRTVYRDIEVLSGLGVPVSVEMGRGGGFKLREGYFLPPVTLGAEEAVSLLLGLILLRRLRVMPFPAEADFAERKLLAALPEETRKVMATASRFIGFERVPVDLLHREPDDPQFKDEGGEAREGMVVSRFLRALLSRGRVRLRYHSPYREEEPEREVEPRGILWDRDRWYLVGSGDEPEGEPRLWRADRVLDIKAGPGLHPVESDFDVGSILDRRWLRWAMDRWRKTGSVKIALEPEQAARLRRDWFYGNAVFESAPDGRVVMSYAEAGPEAAAELVRWLGPGAELLEPKSWRPILAESLRRLLSAHEAADPD
ncbi:MAG: WYL domain-containing protein [Treponema sp.]|nr:WYL domain-containing protein [Treponema sp.]